MDLISNKYITSLWTSVLSTIELEHFTLSYLVLAFSDYENYFFKYFFLSSQSQSILTLGHVQFLNFNTFIKFHFIPFYLSQTVNTQICEVTELLLWMPWLGSRVFCQLYSTYPSPPTCAGLPVACGLPPCWRAPCHSHRWTQMISPGHHVSESNEVNRNYCQQLFMGFHETSRSTHLGPRCHGSVWLSS